MVHIWVKDNADKSAWSKLAQVRSHKGLSRIHTYYVNHDRDKEQGQRVGRVWKKELGHVREKLIDLIKTYPKYWVKANKPNNDIIAKHSPRPFLKHRKEPPSIPLFPFCWCQCQKTKTVNEKINKEEKVGGISSCHWKMEIMMGCPMYALLPRIATSHITLLEREHTSKKERL